MEPKAPREVVLTTGGNCADYLPGTFGDGISVLRDFLE